MTAAEKRDKLVEMFDKLPPAAQDRLLRIAQWLPGKTPEGTPGKDLMEFAGILTEEEAEQMRRVIDEECERIDPHGR